jgi:hypothetical protein
MSTRVLFAKSVPLSLKSIEAAAKRLYSFSELMGLAPPLIGFAYDSDDTSGRGAVLHLHLQLLRLFLHPNPSKLADETESFRRRRLVLFAGDLSTL